MFSLKDLSLLAFDQRRRDPNDNFRTIYGINRVPSDSQMRAILDPVDPADLRTPFREIFRRLQRGKALERFKYLDGHDCCPSTEQPTTPPAKSIVPRAW